MPSLNITFKESASTITQRSNRGVLMLILRGSVPSSNPLIIQGEDDIPSSVSAANKKNIKIAILGNDYAPKKVIAYFIGTEDTIDTALEWAGRQSIDYVAMPTAETDGVTDKIAEWVVAQKAFNNEVKAVLPNCAYDNEYVINVTTESVTTSDGKYTTEELSVRIAGLICGTDISHSVTYAELPEAVDCTRLAKTEMDKAVDEGKIIVFYDGEKVKVSRGVNSLVTLTAEKKESFKKIKIIEAVSMIKKDLRLLIQDNYIGKYANTYSNRCLLLAAVQDYFDTLIVEGVVAKHEITFNLSAIKSAMKSANIDYSDLTDEEIVSYDFGEKVFLHCKIRILDAIEDVDILINNN